MVAWLDGAWIQSSFFLDLGEGFGDAARICSENGVDGKTLRRLDPASDLGLPQANAHNFTTNKRIVITITHVFDRPLRIISLSQCLHLPPPHPTRRAQFSTRARRRA